MGVDGLKIKFEKFFSKKKKIFEIKFFFFFVSRPSTPKKFHVFIFDLLAFSGKIFLREKISTRFLSPFCILLFFLFQKHFFGNFLLWTDGNFSSPLENGLHFGTSLLPGRMVQFFNSHQSFFPNRWANSHQCDYLKPHYRTTLASSRSGNLKRSSKMIFKLIL